MSVPCPRQSWQILITAMGLDTDPTDQMDLPMEGSGSVILSVYGNSVLA